MAAPDYSPEADTSTDMSAVAEKLGVCSDDETGQAEVHTGSSSSSRKSSEKTNTIPIVQLRRPTLEQPESSSVSGSEYVSSCESGGPVEGVQSPAEENRRRGSTLPARGLDGSGERDRKAFSSPDVGQLMQQHRQQMAQAELQWQKEKEKLLRHIERWVLTCTCLQDEFQDDAAR